MCECPAFPALFVEETVLSPESAVNTITENHFAEGAWIYYWVLYFICLWIHFYANTMLFCCYGSVIYFEIKYHEALGVQVFFIFIYLFFNCTQDWDHLCFHMNFRIMFSSSFGCC